VLPISGTHKGSTTVYGEGVIGFAAGCAHRAENPASAGVALLRRLLHILCQFLLHDDHDIAAASRALRATTSVRQPRD
jgi:hypothetical protein